MILLYRYNVAESNIGRVCEDSWKNEFRRRVLYKLRWLKQEVRVHSFKSNMGVVDQLQGYKVNEFVLSSSESGN